MEASRSEALFILVSPMARLCSGNFLWCILAACWMPKVIFIPSSIDALAQQVLMSKLGKAYANSLA